MLAIADDTSTITIINSDPLPSWEINVLEEIYVNEGDKVFTYNVNLDYGSVSENPLDINYLIRPFSATPGADYNLTSSGTITIPSLGTSATLSIPLIDDNVIEENEYFALSLGYVGADAENYSTGFAVFINDDDTGPYFDEDSKVFSVVENTLEVGNVSASDADGDTISYSLSGTDAGSLAINNNGVITFTTAPDFEAQASFEVIVTASDSVNEATQAITININDVNEAPTITSTVFAFNAAENQTTIEEGLLQQLIS